jgi:hypothetical protein
MTIKKIVFGSRAGVLIGTFILICLPAAVIWSFLTRNRTVNDDLVRALSARQRLIALQSNRAAITGAYERLFGNAGREAEDPSVRALKAVEQLAEQSAVKIMNIRPNTAARRGHFREIALEFTAQADKEHFVRFLHGCSAGESLLVVRKCILRARKDSPLLDAQFVIVYNAV